MNTPMISKSSFIRGMQCPKSLWLHLNQPDNRDEISDQQQQIFDTGHNIGFLAQQLFPGGIDASKGGHSKIFEAVSFTKELIAKGQTIIYEAAFSDGETLCYLDILMKEKDGWAAYEVKASTGVRDYQILDVAFQYFVINRSGSQLKKVSLVNVNNLYVRRDDLDIRQFFTIELMNYRVTPMQETIQGELLQLQQMLKAGAMPDISMGRQCTNPFPCDFQGFCNQPLPQHLPTQGIRPGVIRKRWMSLSHNSSILFILWTLKRYSSQFLITMKAGPTSRSLSNDRCMLFKVARKRGRENIQHHEYLGIPPADPRPDFIRSLLNHLDDHGSIIVWNKTFENTRLNEIARDFPEYSDRIDSLLERVIDLMVPFRRKHLYTAEMNGSYSLKAVLPALVPDLSYDDLEIQEW
jgi:hypothetical protein